MEIFNPRSRYYYKKNREVLEKFLQYRTELCTRLNEDIIVFVKNIKPKNPERSLNMTITQIDSIIDTTMKANIGIDPESFIHLQRVLGFDFQVEDPFTLWSRGPDRYRIIGSTYRSRMVPGARLTVDINIVNRIDTKYPTSKQTGLEFLTLLYTASSHADQVCVYAAHTPYDYDFQYAPYALAGLARLNKLDERRYSINSPYTVVFETETNEKEFLVNGKPWPCVSKHGVILPAGNSIVQEVIPSEGSGNKLLLTDLTAEIGECSRKGRDIVLQYNESRNILVSFNKRPSKITLNEKDVSLPLFFKNGTVTIACPAGANKVVFADEDNRNP
jgi:hypothetical protein